MPTANVEILNSPTYWIALLDGAKRQGCLGLAQQALAGLRRLGVLVRFVRPRSPRRERRPHHVA